MRSYLFSLYGMFTLLAVILCPVSGVPAYEKAALEKVLNGEKNLRGLDLSGAALTNMDLRNRDFTGALLDGVDFRGSNLTGARFLYARMRGVSLSHVQADFTVFDGVLLVKSKLESSSFRHSSFNQANMGRSFLSDTVFADTRMRRTDLRRCVIRKCSFKNSIMAHANFDFAKVENSDISFSDLSSCRMKNGRFFRGKFKRSDLSLVKGENLHLTHCDLSWATLKGSSLLKARITASDFLHAYAVGADFSRTVIRDASLKNLWATGANFSGAGISGSDFSGARFFGARFLNTFVAQSTFSGAHFTVSLLSRNHLDKLISKGVSWKEEDILRIQQRGALLKGIVLKEVNLDDARIFRRWRSRSEFAAAGYRGNVIWVKDK